MKKLLSVFLCVMMVLLMSVTPAALAQEEELSKDVTINVYSWWDPTKVGMVNLTTMLSSTLSRSANTTRPCSPSWPASGWREAAARPST